MLLQTWSQVFTQAFQDVSTAIIGYMPQLIVALGIFIIGWMIGVIFGRLVAQLIKALKIDNFLREAGLEEFFGKAGFDLDSGRFLGGLIKWYFVVIFLVFALEILDLEQVNQFLRDAVLGYLPNVVAAVLILLIAAVIAEFMQKLVTGSAKAAELPSARFLGSATRWAIWVFAILAAMAQLSIATAFVQTLFTGIVIAISLAVGLAFGLGGQQAAARYIEHFRHDFHIDEEDARYDKEKEEMTHEDGSKKKKKKKDDDDDD